MPVSSSTYAAVPYLLTPSDAAFAQAVNTDLQNLAQINLLQPVGVKSPTVASYTLLSTDYQRTITSLAAGGAMTVVVPSTLSTGFTFNTFRFNNNLTLSLNSGSILGASIPATSTMAFTLQYQSGGFVWDGGNVYAMWSNSNFP